MCVFFWQFIGIMICTVLYTDYEGNRQLLLFYFTSCTSTIAAKRLSLFLFSSSFFIARAPPVFGRTRPKFNNIV